MPKYRSISALLAAAMLLASCGQQSGENAGDTDTSADDTSAETTALQPSGYELAPGTYKGRTFTIATPSDGTRYIPGQFDTPESSTDIIMEAAYRRNVKVEEMFGIKIEHVTPSKRGEDFRAAVRQEVMAGTGAYDAISNFLGDSGPLVTEGIFAQVSELPHIDLSDPWYPQNLNKAAEFNGKQSFFFTDMTCIPLSTTYGVFYNSDLGEKYKIEDLSQLALDGKWTIDKLLDYSKLGSADLNGDGKWDENDQYGIGQYFNPAQANVDEPVMYQIGMGQMFTRMNEKNEPELILNSDRMVTVASKLAALYHNDNRMNQSADYKVQMNSFSTGKELFCTSIIMFAAVYFREMEDHFTLLPMPKLDEKQEDYHTSVSIISSMIYAIPVSANDLVFASAVMDVLSYEGSNRVIPAFFETSMKVKYSRDEATTQVFDLLRDSTTVDFAMIYDIGTNSSGMTTIAGTLVTENSTDFSSKYASLEPTAIERYNTVVKALNENQ